MVIIDGVAIPKSACSVVSSSRKIAHSASSDQGWVAELVLSSLHYS